LEHDNNKKNKENLFFHDNWILIINEKLRNLYCENKKIACSAPVISILFLPENKKRLFFFSSERNICHFLPDVSYMCPSRVGITDKSEGKVSLRQYTLHGNRAARQGV
jgi:hypothetical protein